MNDVYCLENIEKTFKQGEETISVLRGISLKVKSGDSVAIIGASGSGKSTLLQIMGTLELPSSGSITLNGKEISSLTWKERARVRNQNIGFVFQFHHLLPEFTALENICIPAFIAGISEKAAIERAMDLLGFFGLKERATHKPAALSGGEQQRIAVARALINEPSVILADEPSGNLDSAASTALHELFFELRENFGQTFIIVTHNPQLADMADRKLQIIDGIIPAIH